MGSQVSALSCLRVILCDASEQCGWCSLFIHVGVVVVTWNQQLREGASTFLTVYPILGLHPGREDGGIRPGEKQ